MQIRWFQIGAVVCAVGLGLFAAVAQTAQTFQPAGEVTVISRESGSGTRSAFTDLFSLMARENGTDVDLTSPEAIVTNKTGVAMIDVASNPNAIGYISLGSMNDTVKALRLNGVEASVATIRSGEYTAARAFYLVLGGRGTPIRDDFINFVLSQQGQALAEEHGFVRVTQDAPAYASKGVQGKLVIAGSSSVTPLMETMAEAYLALNPSAAVEVQMNDSASGIAGVVDGTCDIGMSSRALTSQEIVHAQAVPVALDGILIIVHPANPLEDISSETLREIYLGNIPSWDALQ